MIGSRFCTYGAVEVGGGGEQKATGDETNVLFEVEDLSGLQKVLRHFDKTNLDYEFYLDF